MCTRRGSWPTSSAFLGLPSILRGLGLTAADGRGEAAGAPADRSGTLAAHASGGSETPVEAAATPGAVAGAAATDDSVPQALVWSLVVFLLLCLMPLVAVARRKRRIAATPSPAPREARASAPAVTPDNRGDAADEAPYLPPPWADGSARR